MNNFYIALFRADRSISASSFEMAHWLRWIVLSQQRRRGGFDFRFSIINFVDIFLDGLLELTTTTTDQRPKLLVMLLIEYNSNHNEDPTCSCCLRTYHSSATEPSEKYRSIVVIISFLLYSVPANPHCLCTLKPQKNVCILDLWLSTTRSD